MSKSVDETIREAIERGEFENLKNKGKKLNLDDYFNTPEELRVGYSVLKSAEFIPEEVTMLKEINELKEKLAQQDDPNLRKKLQIELNDKQLKYNLLTERGKKFR